MSSLISITEAKRRIQLHRMPRHTEWKPLAQIRNQVLAEAILAPFDSPRFNNSAMDGFAVKWEDVKGTVNGLRRKLTVVGESSAGGPFGKELLPGEAIRISTGALVPEGADTVIPQEECIYNDDRVVILTAKKFGQHVRKKGEEYSKGEKLLDTGTLVTPAVTGVLGSIGMDPAPVHQSPEITLLITGSELTRPTKEKNLNDGEIYDSNRPMLTHYLKLSGVDNIRSFWVRDTPADVREAIRHAKKRSDIIISTGGISVGPHDHIPRAVEASGFKIMFTRVAQKPGKPFLFATGEKTLYFGLPGNPVSALMLFTWYIYPEIRWYVGREDGFIQREGKLTIPVPNARNKSILLGSVVCQKNNQWEILPLVRQASHKLHPLVMANGFIIIPPFKNYEAGETVIFYLFPFD